MAEVLLASGILILVVASVVALSRFVIRGYALTSSRTQALYLAQEGLERVRNIRDTAWIDGDPATDFVATIVNGSNYATRWNTISTRWELISGPETIPPGSLGAFQPLSFTRSITIQDANVGDARLDPHMKQVIVTVDWTEGGRNWRVSAETYLTNWKPEA